MSNFNTGNPVPSDDPRDLTDNATVLDLLLTGDDPSYPDRKGVLRKSYSQFERDIAALVSQNLLAFAALSGSPDKVPYFTGAGALSLTTLTSVARTLTAQATVGDMLTFLTAAPLASPTFTGTPAAPTAAVGTATTQLATTQLIQNEIANKRTWTSWTPTITASSGTWTSASAAGEYVVIMGICYFILRITITTRGTGVKPVFTLPVTAHANEINQIFQAIESAANGKAGYANVLSTTTARCSDYANADLVTADGNVVRVKGFYRVA